jgi:hypothetical protein
MTSEKDDEEWKDDDEKDDEEWRDDDEWARK